MFPLKKSIFHPRRFVFKANAIATLEDKAKSKSVPSPTSYEALIALFWKCPIASIREIPMGLKKPSI